MKRSSLQIKAYCIHADTQRFRSLGALVSIRASTEQTGGAFNLFDVLCPAGYETPLHIHYAEDVVIHVIKGELEVFWGDENKRAESGSFFFLPRGTPHGFRVIGTGTAHILYMTLPAGFDTFVNGRSEPIADAELMVSEAHYKIEVLGSLPAEGIGIQKSRKGETK